MPTAVKPTQKRQDERLERISDLKKTRSDLSELVGLKNSPEWAKLVNVLRRYATYAEREEKIANVEHEKDELSAELFSKHVIRFRQKKADFEFIIGLIENTEDRVASLEGEIARVERIYKESKELLA